MQLDLLEEESSSIILQDQHSPIIPGNEVQRSEPMSDIASPHDEEVLPSAAEEKAPGAFKTISEVASYLSVPQHVLRFWESRFSQIKPMKSRGGRRYYRPEDVETLTTIKRLLYQQGYTIKGAKQAFRAQAEPAFEQAEDVPVQKPVSDKQMSQLAVIRQELIGLRDTLKPYVF